MHKKKSLALRLAAKKAEAEVESNGKSTNSVIVSPSVTALLILLFQFSLILHSIAQPSTEIVITTAAVVRQDPPANRLLYVKGEPIGAFKKNSKLLVLDKRTVKSAFQSELWYKVQGTDSLSRRRITGWIYGGKTN